MANNLNSVSEQIDSRVPVPPAFHQTTVEADKILHSANAGVIVRRTGQLKNGFRSEGRQFARELAEYINTKQVGVASVFVYEETFGTKDRIHWFIHMKSLDDYETMVQMGTTDEDFRNLFFRNRIPAEKGGGSWDQMFLDASLNEIVLLPQFWGMFGTRADGTLEKTTSYFQNADSRSSVPPAYHQTSVEPDQILHSANAGIIIHRTAQLSYNFRSEGRQFAREVAESINSRQAGAATVFVYEEAFGPQDRIHWITHMKSLGTFHKLLEMHVREEEIRDIYFRERIPIEKGGGTWAKMFVEGSIVDTALTPQHWGMYATKR